MTIRGMVAALLAAPLLLAGAQTVAQAAPDPALTIESVTVNKTSVAVSGLNTVPITVTVKGKYDTGSPTSDAKVPVNVLLERTGGIGQMRHLLSTNLPRNQATGTWTGPIQVPSTANGTFKVIGVMTGPFYPGTAGMSDPTPYAGPSISVTGTHQPKVTALVTPRVVQYNQPYTIKWAVSDAQTGKPYGTRIRVELNTDSGCVENFGPGYTHVTDTNGIVTETYPGVSITPITCLLLPGSPDAIGWLSFVPKRQALIAAVPSKSSAPVGTVVPVNGSVSGGPFNCKVHLQRLYGASQWRTVSSGATRASGRFTVNAQPAYRGLIPYRVYLPACGSIVPGVSKVFYVRGT
jgi:hypothetical protein